VAKRPPESNGRIYRSACDFAGWRFHRRHIGQFLCLDRQGKEQKDVQRMRHRRIDSDKRRSVDVFRIVSRWKKKNPLRRYRTKQISLSKGVEADYKPYFIIGFQNDWGGYELWNGYFQGGLSPKTITTMRNGNDACLVFEGFMDYLSYLTLLHGRNPAVTTGKRDYIILNSVSNVSKAIDIIGVYKAKFCYLDNDKGGVSAFREIRSICGENVLDRSMYYRGYKDLNNYLTGKKLMVENQKKRGLKM
jgi:hypothetical protein